MTRYIGEIYRDVGGDYRWRVRAATGQIVADSAEGYENRSDCAQMLGAVTRVDEVIGPDDVDKGRAAKPTSTR